MHMFFYRMQKNPIGTLDRFIQPFHQKKKKNTIKNPGKKGAEEDVMRKMKKLALSSSQASSAPPELSSTTGTDPPTWGQLKKLTQRTQQMISG
jgi:hypothetical protein